jgi:hypothetical protein
LFAVIAFVVGALRFVPSLAISLGVTHFATGFGVGLLVAALVTWVAERVGT